MNSPSKSVLRDLGFRSYAEYLESDHWRSTRAKYYRACVRACHCCGATDDLQLHHMTYKRLGREKNGDLICVCRACHKAIHSLVKERICSLRDAVRAVRITRVCIGSFSGEMRMKRRRNSDVKISFAGR